MTVSTIERWYTLRKTPSPLLSEHDWLIAVKSAIGHGHFSPWLASEFGWSHDTARTFINVAERFGDMTKISSFAPSALYALPSPSTPEDVRVKFTELASIGKQVMQHKGESWSNREIARRCAVAESTVRNILGESSAQLAQIDTPRTVTRNGSMYEMNTANIGKRPVPDIRAQMDAGPALVDEDTGEILDDELPPYEIDGSFAWRSLLVEGRGTDGNPVSRDARSGDGAAALTFASTTVWAIAGRFVRSRYTRTP